MGYTMTEVIENNLISEELLDIIPEYCEYCGEEIMFTESLSQIYCGNRFCTVKIAARLEAMAKNMKVDGWGESTCIKVCQRFNLKSPYQVFLLEGKDYDGVAAFPKKIKAICESENRKTTLWEMVRYANIPSIDTIAYKIFDGYKTIEEAYRDIEKYQVPFIANKLGINNTNTGVLAVNVYNILMEYKTELLFGEEQFEIYEKKGQKMYIAITGGVNNYRNKSEFISYINDRYEGKINAILMNSVNKQTHALVADGDTSSSKYRKASKMSSEGHSIIITTSRGLIDSLDKVLGQ